MDQKQCPKCVQFKDVSEFNQKTARGVRHRYCKQCQSEFNRKHYDANKQAYIERAAKRKVRLKEELDELKRRPCSDCGKTYHPWQMDFDHVRGTKSGNISTMKMWGASRRLREELVKCDLVCANCHRHRTHMRQQARLLSGRDSTRLSES